MRIFMVCDVPLDGRDAQTTHIIELLRNIKKRNDVICFAPKPKNIRYKFQEIVYTPVFLNKPIISFILCHLNLFFLLGYYCSKTKPDAIYVRQSGFTFSPLAISKLFRISYFAEVNGLMLEEAKVSNISLNKLNVGIIKMSENSSYKHAKKIIAVTQGVKEGIKELYNIPDEKIVVIENGANTDLFKPLNKKKCCEELKLNKSNRHVCFVGALAPWQGVEFLIQSAPLILKKNPNTKFLIIGDGMLKKELMELADKTGVSGSFIFKGIVPYEEVPKYINASDVCVHLPFGKRNERVGASSLKLFEYMACGKPIITGDVSGIPKEIERVNAGILVSCNLQEIANNIIKLLKSEKLREEMGKNGRKCVVENHSWGIIAEKVAKVCENVIKQRKYR